MLLEASPQDSSRRIRAAAVDLGFDAVGIVAAASLEGTDDGARYLDWLREELHGGMDYLARAPGRRLDPAVVLPDAASIVCVAKTYWSPDPGTADPGPARGTIARYARGRDYHKVFTRALRRLEDALAEILPGAATRRYVDTGPVLEKLWAERAGLGWRGKHTNLVSRLHGSWLLLGEILVAAPLEPDQPEADHCGTCTRCLDACPTGAITGPYRLDARLCISYLTIEHRGSIPVELRPALGGRIFGCDDCLDACPWNRFAVETREADFRPRPETLAPLLTELVALDADGFYARFQGTPVTRAKREGLARNACVALGNLGGPGAVEALAAALHHDPSPLVREHAAWALGRQWCEASRDALVHAHAREHAPEVRAAILDALSG